MKKILPFFGIFLLTAFFFGCEELPTEPEVVAAPANLSIAVAGNDSLSIKLSWDASTDTADGYIVYFEDDVIDSTIATVLTYTHTPTSLGDYEVTAYKGDIESDPTNTVSTSLKSTLNPVGPVYWMDAPTAVGYSGYGWDDNGIGNTHSMASETDPTAQAMVDFYMDSVGFDKGTDKIISPDNLYDEWNKTWLYDCEANVYDTLSVAPGWGSWTNWGDASIENNTLLLFVKNKYYVKIQITEHNTSDHHYIKFHYGFQEIAGFRRLK